VGRVVETLSHPAFLVTYALIQAVLFLLLIRFLDLYEREPLSVLALMAAWGATGAVAISLIGNQVVSDLLPPKVGEVFGPSITAPLVEEAAKGLSLIVTFVLSWWAARRFGVLELEGVTDGIVYGAAVGLGFAFTEDLLYLLNTAGEQGLGAGLKEYASRVNFFGAGQLGHAVYTGAFGAGLGLATWSRGWTRWLGFPLLGLAAAMLMHAVHNGLASFVLVWRYGLENTAAALSGVALPEELFERMRATADAANAVAEASDYVFVAVFAVAVALWLRYQRRVIRQELEEEVKSGLIDRDEWELMPRYLRRSKQYWGLLWAGKPEHWRQLKRIHSELVDLAFLKWRLARIGGDWDELERRRRRIANLHSQKVVE
jgi:RsiW-degrading membrane proteinase PrsW (M82 family)